jgi:diguanylate cyclase (GGDEF)-like protein
VRKEKLSAIWSMNKAALLSWDLEKTLSTIVDILPKLVPCKLSAIFFNEERSPTLFLNTTLQNQRVVDEFKSKVVCDIKKEFDIKEEELHYIMRSAGKNIEDGRVQHFCSLAVRAKEVDFLFSVADTQIQRVGREELEHIFTHCALLLENCLLQQRLQKLRIHDRLTGVYALNYLVRLLHSEIKRAERYKLVFSLVIMEIEDFSRINLIYGYQQADALLREIAARIKASIREVDIVGRYKGAGFAAILPETTKIRAMVAASHMREAVQMVWLQNERVSARIGVSTYPYDATTVEELFNRAQVSLESSKGDVSLSD